MEQTKISNAPYQNPENKEDLIIDRDSNVFDPVLSVNTVTESRSRLSVLGVQNAPFIDVVKLSIFPYCLEQSYQFPEFVNWCATHYSHSERVIVDTNGSESLCRVDTLSVRESLGLHKDFSQGSETFNET
jgi:hypothetical protein